ncbi:ABC transporter substrate-binding protein [Mesorhizobium australicum]|uniref:Amino acid/amide ABC transporter substrate-binding protein, HAAT family n=1 Tax=Mesorhizobium australicum TaxID=536018 RepID=A0A1X7NW95_9HYPH|nr:ABC transporter substrate-binding protein [Mesorhizobium australicum]SMH42029.1 amino acid/amide ABC transporter substrate-binding protein, HAAT family [Mesorhizobium australicum]
MSRKTQSLLYGLPILAASLTVTIPTRAADPFSDNVIRIGLINDQSGIYSDTGGPGSVEAARMAIEDFGGEIDGKKIELVVADDQSKPDIGASIVQRWIDKDGVDVIAGGSLSSIAIAIQKITTDNKKPYLIAGPASSGLTNENCTAMSTQWVLDTYALARGIIRSMVADGNDTYYFVTVDYTFGKQSQADATKFIEEAGGKVVGSVLHPLNTNDLSSYLLQAQASGAKVIVLANAGSDFANAMKQSQEFGIQAGGQKVVALGLQINQTHGIGIEAAQGMSLVTPFYWGMNDQTRAFAERFKKRFRDRVPNETMAGFYSAITHYLKAVKEAGTDEGEAVVAKMHEMPVNDFEMSNVKIRADGQVMRPMYSVTVKAPNDVKEPYDYYTVGSVIPAEDLWRPASQSACPLMK